jgi:hypothetical protein
MNVPETMNEVLDMSDDEGMKMSTEFVIVVTDCIFAGFLKKVQCKSAFGNIGMFCCDVGSVCFSNTYIVHLNHTVHKANAPEMLSDGEYISDIEEGICKFLL